MKGVSMFRAGDQVKSEPRTHKVFTYKFKILYGSGVVRDDQGGVTGVGERHRELKNLRRWVPYE